MKVYLVNLTSRPDRLQHMDAELGRVGVPFVHVPAADAKTDPEVAAQADRGAGQSGDRISDGAVACTLSHRRIWQTFLDTGDAACIVLEDDLFLADDFAACLEDGWIPDDADVVKLETFAMRTHIDRAVAGRVAGSRLHRLRRRHPGTGGYLITRRGAEQLLAALWPPVDPIDEVMFNEEMGWMPGAVIYQATPALLIQADRYTPAKGDDLAFAESSIPLRSDTESRGAEGIAARLIRRATNEIAARFKGTIYTIVPFTR